MNRLKAWFRNTVVAEVRKALDFLSAEYELAIHALFVTERARLVADLAKAEDKLCAITLEVHNNAMMNLASEMRQKMDSELEAFKARVQHTLEETIKEAPAHWRADEEALKNDITLRTPKR